MGLVDLASVSSYLACPGCRSTLVRAGDRYRCHSSSCELARDDGFPHVGRWPVLVDFRESIVAAERFNGEDEAAPLVGRRWAVQRLPEPLRAVWKPRNRVAAANIDRLLAEARGNSPLVLVVGGGTMGNGTEALYATERVRLIGFDVYRSPLTQFVADAHQIPLIDDCVDAVVIQAVLEHVLDPIKVVAEIARVLSPGGVVYAETPFLQQVHAGPYDFVRYTGSGHRYLFRAFEEIAAGPVAGPGTALAWSVDHLTRGLTRSELAGKVARGLVFWLRYLDALVPHAYAMDSASAYYFLGRLDDRRLEPGEIVDYYRGAQQAAT
jgi:SAM-dependent methyltransferase